jgi:peptide deformylase
MNNINQISKEGNNLRKKSRKVDPTSLETKKLIKKLKETIEENDNALAIAAPQIGINKRVSVIKRYRSKEENISIPGIILINPKIISKSREKIEAEEGCLSVAEPELRALVSRAQTIKVKYQNSEGQTKELTAEGLLARVIQHEIDHLNGKIFLDRANPETIYQVNQK